MANSTTQDAGKLLHSTDGSLMIKKLYELFPVMVLNRLSVMVMLSVDSIVVGWKIGEKALASVNYYQPFQLLLLALVALVSNGIATLISKQLGENDHSGIERKKKAIVYSTLIITGVLSVIQIPVCLFSFDLYNMDEAVYDMALRYAYASMLATPFVIVDTVGAYLLLSIGRAKTVLHASLLQCVVNTVLDVIFVFGFDMSTDGAGLGTLFGRMSFCFYVLNHLFKHSEFLQIDRNVKCLKEMLDIAKYGTAGMFTGLMNALFATVFLWFVSKQLLHSGAAIHSVCLFAASLVRVIALSMHDAMQSLTGMLSTLGDAVGMHRLLKRAMLLCLLLCGGIALTAEFFPVLFFKAYGYYEVTDMGIAALRAYALHFFFIGLNFLLRLYFNCWNDAKFASMHTLFNTFILPTAFAAVFFLLGNPWTLWLCYGLAHGICFIVAWIRYYRKYQRETRHIAPNEFNIITTPDKAPQTAEELQQVMLENGISRSLANRTALCVEEIGAYAVPIRNDKEVTIQLYARVTEKEAAIIVLDDGQRVAFPKSSVKSSLAAGNYDVLKHIASECSYDYVLNLNHFMVNIRDEKK